MRVREWYKAAHVAQRLLVALLCLVQLRQASGMQQLTLREECPNGTLVGYVQVPEAVRERAALRLIKYPPDLFILNGTALYTKGRVDREALCSAKAARCELPVSLTAEPAMAASVRVAVLVEDVNDWAPRFASDEFTLAVSEAVTPNTPGAAFDLPLASDEDQRFGVQSYRLAQGADQFGLEVQRLPNSEVERVALVLRKPLDRERRDSYQLLLVAHDAPDGTRAHSATLTIRVTVLDANDHRPAFTRPVWRVPVPEDFSPQAVIVTVTALDQDLDQNGQIHYELVPGAPRAVRDKFAVERDSGEVRLRDTLDFETQRSYTIPVSACDQAQPPLCSHATVEVVLIDVNDEAPSIVVAYENDAHAVHESAANGTVVAFVTVTDRDSGAAGISGVHCSIDNDRFALSRRAAAWTDNTTLEYSVITIAPLDRERLLPSNPQELIAVLCQDGGEQRQANSAMLTLNVLDANDNAPKFIVAGAPVSAHVTRVHENAPPGALVATLLALDEDAGENASVTYTLTAGALDAFVIDPYTGVLTTRRPLDCEVNATYTLSVSACDKGRIALCSSLQLTVFLLDLNDCTPHVISTTDFVVSEAAAIGTVIGNLRAVDCDATVENQRVAFQPEFELPPHDQWLYSLTAADFFSVERDGSIRLKRTLDREARDFYRFAVRVHDFGSPQLSMLVNITVHVLDADDNDPLISFVANPFFQLSNTTVVVSYLEPAGTAICEARAADADLLSGAESFTFAIRDGNADGVFNIDPLSGVISLASPLGTELIGVSRVLRIEVFDGVRRGFGLLRVLVDDSPSRSPANRNAITEQDSSSDSLLSTRSVLTICACLLTLLIIFGLFTFVYMRYFYENVGQRRSRRLKKKPIPAISARPRPRPRPRRRQSSNGDTKAALAMVHSSPLSKTDFDRQRRVSILSDGDVVLSLSATALNQLGLRSLSTDSGGDYSALDHVTETGKRQLVFQSASHFGYDPVSLDPSLTPELPASRSLASFRRRTNECVQCGVQIVNECTENVWRHSEITCARLDSQLSHTASHNQDGSTICSANDESGSDNNAPLTHRTRLDEADELHPESTPKRAPQLATQASSESRAFSLADSDTARAALGNKQRAIAPNQYALCDQSSLDPDSTDKLLSLAPFCSHAQPGTCCHAARASPPNLSAAAAAATSTIKRSESLWATQLTTDSPRRATRILQVLSSSPPSTRDHLVAQSGTCDSSWLANDSALSQDLNANKLGSTSANRTSGPSAVRALSSRAEPETSYV